jgi:hypothetical protein
MFLKELIVCVAYLRQKSGVNFRATKVDAGKLKHKHLNRPWPTLAVKVLTSALDGVSGELHTQAALFRNLEVTLCDSVLRARNVLS